MKKEIIKYVVVDRPVEVFKDRIVEKNVYIDKIVTVDRPVEVIKEVQKLKTPEKCVFQNMIDIEIPADF